MSGPYGGVVPEADRAAIVPIVDAVDGECEFILCEMCLTTIMIFPDSIMPSSTVFGIAAAIFAIISGAHRIAHAAEMPETIDVVAAKVSTDSAIVATIVRYHAITRAAVA